MVSVLASGSGEDLAASAAARTASRTSVSILSRSSSGTPASVNPARSIGPALFAGGDALKHLWLFILAPLVGGVLAAVAYGFIRAEPTTVPGPDEEFAT